MSLYFRLLLVLLRHLFLRRQLNPLESARLTLRVWPSDLDINLHLNNGRYHMLMDLGRFDLMLRMGLVSKSLRERWMPVVSDVKIRYRHSLDPLERFELQTRLVGWDRKWFYLEQRFERKGQLMARALVRTAFVSKGRTLNVAEVIAAMGVSLPPPEIPAEFESGWLSRPGTQTLPSLEEV
ncbi:MAG: thioesterase [Candidatus Melainabacteria bacterium HGW-Melainabacteria-1]|nr:MAG: thioesterase [Candidatus Melainabacteria bacterium HGW-Melainabacteria-1]